MTFTEIPSEKELAITDLVRERLVEHSGGVKFLELLVEVNTSNIGEVEPEILEQVIRGMTNVRILEYTWYAMNRHKMFVYTP